MKAGWRSWEEVKTVVGNRDKWKDSVKALCGTTGTKRIGVGEGEIYRIELDSNVSEIARKKKCKRQSRALDCMDM